MNCILDNSLYISNTQTANNEMLLRQNSITHIIGFDALLNYYGIHENNVMKLSYLTNKVNLLEYFHDINLKIDNVILQGGRILIHCNLGINSFAITLAFLIYKYKTNVRDSIKFLHSKNLFIKLDEKFIEKLTYYEYFINKMDVDEEIKFF